MQYRVGTVWSGLYGISVCARWGYKLYVQAGNIDFGRHISVCSRCGHFFNRIDVWLHAPNVCVYAHVVFLKTNICGVGQLFLHYIICCAFFDG